jgi:hypothetical protein
MPWVWSGEDGVEEGAIRVGNHRRVGYVVSLKINIGLLDPSPPLRWRRIMDSLRGDTRMFYGEGLNTALKGGESVRLRTSRN